MNRNAKVVGSLLLFFLIILPSSERSTEKDFGILIQNHKKAEQEYGDLYQDILAVSTVNHDNNLQDNFELSESVSYLRTLSKKKYKIETYQDCRTNAKGEEICTEKERETLISTKEYQGEDLIEFGMGKLNLREREQLLKNETYKRLLKLQYIFPDEVYASGKISYRTTYEMKRLRGDDILYETTEKQEWFLFLKNEAIESIYNDFINQMDEESGKISSDTSDVNTPYDPSKGTIVDFAKKYLGTPYVWGSEIGKTETFDCSSYTAWIYKSVYKINLPRVSYDQYKSLSKVEKKNLQTGDLVFFYTGSGNTFNPVTHVGMYIGEGKFIHASSRGGVKVSDLNSRYWKNCYRGGGRKK